MKEGKEWALTFDATTTMQQRAYVPLYGGHPDELMTDEIGVVRRRDEVLGYRSRHIVPYIAMVVREHGVVS